MTRYEFLDLADLLAEELFPEHPLTDAEREAIWAAYSRGDARGLNLREAAVLGAIREIAP